MNDKDCVCEQVAKSAGKTLTRLLLDKRKNSARLKERMATAKIYALVSQSLMKTAKKMQREIDRELVAELQALMVEEQNAKGPR